jgi:hypothetical protein
MNNEVQKQLEETTRAAAALADALYHLNRLASQENNNIGCLMHMLVMPQLQAACEIRNQVEQLNNSYNYKPE